MVTLGLELLPIAGNIKQNTEDWPDCSSSFLLFLLEPHNEENHPALFLSSAFFFFCLKAAAS